MSTPDLPPGLSRAEDEIDHGVAFIHAFINTTQMTAALLLQSAHEVSKNPKLHNLHQLMRGKIAGMQKALRAKSENHAWWDIPVELIALLSSDPKKLWESATKEQFQGNGKYNQASLSDDGKLIITMIKPWIVESKSLQIPPEQVTAVRKYVQKNWFVWDKTWEWYEGEYSGLGGAYIFDRTIPLLDPAEEKLALHWVGRHVEPVVEGGPFQMFDTAKIVSQ